MTGALERQDPRGRSVIHGARASVGGGSFGFRLTGRAEREALDEAPGEAAGLLASAVRGREVVVHVGDVLVGLAEAGLLLSMSPAEQQLGAALEEAHCRKQTAQEQNTAN